MPANEQPTGTGPKIEVVLEELHTGAKQLHELAEETKNKLTPSDQTLESSSPAWRGLKSATAFAAYAEHETARGQSATETINQAAENVDHAAERYEHTDTTNAEAINRAAGQ